MPCDTLTLPAPNISFYTKYDVLTSVQFCEKIKRLHATLKTWKLLFLCYYAQEKNAAFNIVPV